MLTIHTSRPSRDCTGMSRRGFLRVGTAGLAGITLADLLAARARAAGGEDYMTDKCVVFLYLAGGPPQTEMFDPKMDAPSEVRSSTGEVKTKLAGVTFGGTLPKLAARADKLAIVRSFQHGNNNHDGGKELFGLDERGTALSASYARMLGQTDPVTGMLSTAFLAPLAGGFTPSDMRKYMGFYYSGVAPTGHLPAAFSPFHPSDGASAKKAGLLADMELSVPIQKLEDRRELWRQLDRMKLALEPGSAAMQAMSEHQQQAFDVLRRGISEAFDLSREDPRVIAEYDTTRFKTPGHLIRRQKNGKMSAQSQTALGRQLLLARRLCEAGCRFVTVGMNDWDMHGNVNSYPIHEGMVVMGGALDHAVSVFLDDVQRRGLSEKILLVMTGEMGRTPRITTSRDTGSPGRDHWGELGALALAGGGLNMGQVIGESDRHAGRPATEPIKPASLISTITHTLFDMGNLRLATGLPRDLVTTLASAEPIPQLL